MDSEQRRHQDSLKISNKQERTARDIQFNIDENRKNQAQTQDLIDKLQQKIKSYKKQVEEAVSFIVHPPKLAHIRLNSGLLFAGGISLGELFKVPTTSTAGR